MINICVFEDDGYKELLPLTYYRPTYNLLVGIDTIYDKVYRYFNYANVTKSIGSFCLYNNNNAEKMIVCDCL